LNVEYKGIQPQSHRGIPRLNRDSVTEVIGSRSTNLMDYLENYTKVKM